MATCRVTRIGHWPVTDFRWDLWDGLFAPRHDSELWQAGRFICSSNILRGLYLPLPIRYVYQQHPTDTSPGCAHVPVTGIRFRVPRAAMHTDGLFCGTMPGLVWLRFSFLPADGFAVYSCATTRVLANVATRRRTLLAFVGSSSFTCLAPPHRYHTRDIERCVRYRWLVVAVLVRTGWTAGPSPAVLIRV